MTTGLRMSPLPTDEEAVAIAAALQFAWPQTVEVVAEVSPTNPGPWRFSGRWWNGSLPLRLHR